MEQAMRDAEVLIMQAKETIRAELREQHTWELAMMDKLIALLREKLPVGGGDTALAVLAVEPDPSKYGGGSTNKSTSPNVTQVTDTTKVVALRR